MAPIGSSAACWAPSGVAHPYIRRYFAQTLKPIVVGAKAGTTPRISHASTSRQSGPLGKPSRRAFSAFCQAATVPALTVTVTTSSAATRCSAAAALAAVTAKTAHERVSSGAPLVSSVFLSRLARLGRPLAKRLLPQLSFSNPLMLPEGVGMTALMQFVEKQKVLHKDHVILTQVGDFYEAYGVDAVMLVEFCGLNPMGGKPKAGCPKGSVQAVLDCLTAEGLTVNVYEELPVPPGLGSRALLLRTLKTRVLTQVVSPAAPLFLPSHLSLFQGEIGANTSDSLPIFSLYFSPSLGFCCGEIYVEERRMHVEGGLTAEGARTKIDAALAATGSVPASSGMLCGSSDSSFHRAVLREVASSLSLSPQEFAVSSSARSYRGYWGAPGRAPHPLPTATASQLGLLSSVEHHSQSAASISASLVPPLHKAVLPPNAPAGAARFLQRLLLLPPPPAVADAMQQLLKQLLLLSVTPSKPYASKNSEQRDAPPLQAEHAEMQQQEQLLMPSGKIPHIGKVAQLISTRKANRVLFAELLGLLHPAAYCLEAYPQQLLQPLFLLLQHQTQQRIEQDTLRREVKEAAQRISRVIYQDPEAHDRAADAMALAAAAAAAAARRVEAGHTLDGSGEAAAASAAAAAAAAASSAATQCRRAAAAASHEAESSTGGILTALEEFYQRSESFRCHVQPELVAAPLIRVALAADDLLVAVLRDFTGVSLPSLPPLAGVLTGRVTAQEVLQEAVQSSLQGSNSETFLDPTEHAAVKAAPKEAPEEAPTASPLELKGISVAKGLHLVLVLRDQRQRQLRELQQQQPRLMAALQRWLTADALNDIVYLKKHKPPLAGVAAAAASKEAVELTVPSNAPEAPKVRHAPASLRERSACSPAFVQTSHVGLEKEAGKAGKDGEDRNRRVLTGCWSTPAVMAAVRQYTASCAAATAEVRKQIESLSASLQPLLPAIIQAAHLTSILQAAGHHAAFACSNGWNLPELRNDGGMALQVRDLTPYYLPRSNLSSTGSSSSSNASLATDSVDTQSALEPLHASRGASSVSFDLNGLFLLTGENMAGKSTLCRSTLALTLLANAGLFCPCGSGTKVPRYSAFLSSSCIAHDSPLENKSFFVFESQQLKAVLQQTLDSTSPHGNPAGAVGCPKEELSETHAEGENKATAERGSSTTANTHGVTPSNSKTAEQGEARKSIGEAGRFARSFLILDEPCKGTAPNCGAALLGSVLESLADVRAQGIISTHLHQQLSALPLSLPPAAVSFKQMKICRRQKASGKTEHKKRPLKQEEDAAPKNAAEEHDAAWLDNTSDCDLFANEDEWDYELADGICSDSNALHAAEKAGIPQTVLQRAKALRRYFHPDAEHTEEQAQLDPPPAWASSACVYVLVALERTTAALIGECHAQHIGADAARRLDSVSSQQAALARFEQFETPGEIAARAREGPPKTPTTPPLFGSYRVYVGESERVCERLKRHRAASQWSSALALVLRTPGKSEARKIETETIRRLIGDSEIRLMSIKDGNRR
ncbi:uncharacterized protein LOC34618243 [Cyclospora cayetanensis]|uniref:Uncharacterized protein LOC34618243 n=1 Tax=Cyclospora cayetanensis TaxID=88456 RepID=A0A6P6RYM8_9EIME|nr:uncharacterized protein LOC34618243 [Cyclospora cayetanensis]